MAKKPRADRWSVKTRGLSVSIRRDVHAAALAVAEQKGSDKFSAVVEDALHYYLEKHHPDLIAKVRSQAPKRGK